MATFRHPPRRPSRVTFTAVEPTYEAYGWRVSIKRPALEFSSLQNAGRNGFTLLGSGKGTVVTPSLFGAGAVYSVTVGKQVREVRADRRRRLHIEVPLGPGNEFQEYTTQAQLAGTKVFRTAVRIG